MDSPPLTLESLGFTAGEHGWSREVAGRPLTFRRLRTRADLEQTERLQREVFGVSERDLASFSILIVIHKTGGDVLGAFSGERLVGYIWGYGGYVNGRPRLVSDMMGVEPAWRGGVGWALKAFQACIALADGFPEAVWTVDPLRAANARLNFARLGAHANEYLEDFYGSDFAEGLYAGLPSDRLVVTWPIASPRVAATLQGLTPPTDRAAILALPDYGPSTAQEVRLAIPSDIDAVLARDPARGRAWRYTIRTALQRAFAAGYTITDFAGSRDEDVGYFKLTK
ncbi:MAG: GNAT family N-acetyltransferase [Chloroflexi bacterium]|nr:MAG: GNAT family N-acetyltransferase [Chloroflexota bacterium]